jgi:NADH-quinone oxidoreductase subunit A
MMGTAVAAQVKLWPLALYFCLVIALTGLLLGISYFLGQRHRETQTGKPYESGIVSTGTARVHFDVKFYLNAIFFVIFDLEAMFIIAWAVVIRQAGWSGYFEIVIFIVVLGIALVYLWKQGALDWSPDTGRIGAGEADRGLEADNGGARGSGPVSGRVHSGGEKDGRDES